MIAKSQMPLEENKHPRVHTAQLTGFHVRAHWAQQNGFEAFPLFATAVIAAHVTSIPASTINLWALVFILVRVVYIGLYLFDKATLRTLVWSLGIMCSVVLLAKAGLASL
jgi:uncharacterized MAPEG superfamily protein